jgi:hypothetical protein
MFCRNKEAIIFQMKMIKIDDLMIMFGRYTIIFYKNHIIIIHIIIIYYIIITYLKEKNCLNILFVIW